MSEIVLILSFVMLIPAFMLGWVLASIRSDTQWDRFIKTKLHIGQTGRRTIVFGIDDTFTPAQVAELQRVISEVLTNERVISALQAKVPSEPDPAITPPTVKGNFPGKQGGE